MEGDYMSKVCSHCGETISNDSKFCKSCGKKIDGPKEEEIIQTIEPTSNKQTVPVSGLSITGFVFAMVSLICCGLVSPLGLVFSIIGLIKIDEGDRTGKGLAIAGIIISAIMLVLFILMIIIFNGVIKIGSDIINNIDFSEWNNIIESAIILK